MTPDTPWIMKSRTSVMDMFGKWNKSHGFLHIDWERATDWSMDAVAKRTIAVAALTLLIAGSVPLITSVHGQVATTPLQQEVEDLRTQVAKLDAVPAELAVVIAHQKLEDERYQQQEDFQNKVVWGFLGTSGGLLLALFGWALNQFGVSFGIRSNGRQHYR